ncbi:ATP-binding cassette domain-containing protein [Zavarzinia sp.]|uniref:ATP-binding cassette domain-containing protein n=1 Tax=Zavarzinia sp. TaxID=2027920 RepID=UPI00356A8D75
MEPDFRRFVWRYSTRAQVSLLGLALGSFPFLWLYYEMPKAIVGQIGRIGPGPQHFLGLTLPERMFGLMLDQGAVLLGECLLLGLLVGVNHYFRHRIYRLKTLTAERLLRRIRLQILGLILRFPLHAFRQRTAGEAIAAMGGELDALCAQAGDTVAVPAYQGGTLAVILGFLFVQDPLIGLAAALIYPAGMFAVPRIQHRVNGLSRSRGTLMRGLGERIDETFHLITDIRANHQARWTRAWLAERLGQVFGVRVRLATEKFAIRTVNTLTQQLGPVLFYSLGGYFVIAGRFDIATLVAVIAAHKDMAGPWRELLDWYQGREDARVKYETTHRLFSRPDLLPPAEASAEPQALPDFRRQAVTVEDLTVRSEADDIRLDRARLTLAGGTLTALVGPAGGGRETLAQAIAGLVEPSAGQIAIGGTDLATLPPGMVHRRIAYVGAGAALMAGSIAANLAFGLRLAPPGGALGAAAREALRAGNPPDDPNADWIDYEAAGVPDGAALRRRMVEVMSALGSGEALFRLGLAARLTAAADPALAEGVIAARDLLARRLADAGQGAMIARFDWQAYNDHASLAENLLFGLPADGTLSLDHPADHPALLALLQRCGLAPRLLEAGRRIAAVMVELFADLAPGHEMMRRFALVTPAELARLKPLAGAAAEHLAKAERLLLINLACRVVAARHRLEALDDGLKAAVVAARHELHRDPPPELARAIARFEEGRPNRAASVLDNVLFGRIAGDQAGASSQIPQMAAAVLEELGLGERVRDLGLDFDVGIAGARLSPGERQRIAIARALLRRPHVLVLDDVLGLLDTGCRATVLEILGKEAAAGMTVVAALGDAGHAAGFDRVITMERGRVLRREAGRIPS